MFNSLNLQKLRNAEFLQFMRNIHAIAHEFELSTLAVLLVALNSKSDEFEVMFKSNLKNPFTAEINKWDDTRDRTFRAIVRIVEGNTLHFDSSVATKASVLLEVIRNHGGNIITLNHHEETAVLNSLINEIENSESLSDSISSLHLSTLLAHLKTSNAQCADLLKQRTETNADNSSLSGKDQRKTIRNTYSELLQTIDAHIILKSEGDYQSMKDRINELINEFKATLNLRG